MAESIITGTIYKTRLQDKNCCLRYPSCKMRKKEKKNTKCTMFIVLLWFPEIIFFLCVFLW